MHKNIGADAIGSDKAISAICVEEFDPPTRHCSLNPIQRTASALTGTHARLSLDVLGEIWRVLASRRQIARACRPASWCRGPANAGTARSRATAAWKATRSCSDRPSPSTDPPVGAKLIAGGAKDPDSCEPQPRCVSAALSYPRSTLVPCLGRNDGRRVREQPAHSARRSESTDRACVNPATCE